MDSSGTPTPSGADQGEPVPFEDLRRNVLKEVDPQSDFEAFLKAQALRCTRGGDAVFVFTSDGSPLHRMLEGAEGVSLILMSVDDDAVRRSAGTAGRVPLLALDRAHFLTLLDSLMATKGRVHVFLDSVSSMVAALGFQETYKLLRQSIEIVGGAAGPRINAFAVMIRGTQGEAESNIFRSMFQVLLTYDAAGVVARKPPNLRLEWTRPEPGSIKKRQAPSDERGRRSAARAVRGFLSSLTKGER